MVDFFFNVAKSRAAESESVGVDCFDRNRSRSLSRQNFAEPDSGPELPTDTYSRRPIMATGGNTYNRPKILKYIRAQKKKSAVRCIAFRCFKALESR